MRPLLLLLVSFLLAPAFAQEGAPHGLRASALAAPDLSYPAGPSRLSIFSAPRMALYKPDGDGPFPALVLMHQCGGLRSRAGWQNMAILDWARAAVARGYVALVVDSLGPRNVDTVCMGPRNGVNFARGVRDALLAGAQLATLPYVDKDRIAVAGYSWGAMVTVLASSRRWAGALGDGFRFRAAGAFYPGCFTFKRAHAPDLEVVNPDIDRPLLVLVGGQDTETPAGDCIPRLERIQAAGAPVSVHLYPDATHCWDCKNLDGFSKVDARGSHVVYHYNEADTRDSEHRLFDFLAQAMPHG
ncbi:MAG: dienelactone hydrolase family protein [Burkholderiales bacterium]|nr:dienelactone hydrolase family protein [Burkholderiales bacterium]